MIPFVYKNENVYVGRIASPIKYRKSSNGQEYAWFALEISDPNNAYSTENNRHQCLNIMCFKKRWVDYLKYVKAHENNIAIIFGFSSSFPDEIKGKQINVNAFNVNHMYIAKGEPDK